MHKSDYQPHMPAILPRALFMAGAVACCAGAVAPSIRHYCSGISAKPLMPYKNIYDTVQDDCVTPVAPGARFQIVANGITYDVSVPTVEKHVRPRPFERVITKTSFTYADSPVGPTHQVTDQFYAVDLQPKHPEACSHGLHPLDALLVTPTAG